MFYVVRIKETMSTHIGRTVVYPKSPRGSVSLGDWKKAVQKA
jgi:hypothetical protein